MLILRVGLDRIEAMCMSRCLGGGKYAFDSDWVIFFG